MQILHYVETPITHPQSWNRIIFQAPAPPPLPDPIHIQDSFVPWTSAVRYPSLVLYSKLLFTRHLHTVANKATGVFCNIFIFVARDSAITESNRLALCKLLTRSILTCDAPVCSSTCSSSYYRLQVIQSKCLRVIGNHPRRTPTPTFTTVYV